MFAAVKLNLKKSENYFRISKIYGVCLNIETLHLGQLAVCIP